MEHAIKDCHYHGRNQYKLASLNQCRLSHCMDGNKGTVDKGYLDVSKKRCCCCYYCYCTWMCQLQQLQHFEKRMMLLLILILSLIQNHEIIICCLDVLSQTSMEEVSQALVAAAAAVALPLVAPFPFSFVVVFT